MEIWVVSEMRIHVEIQGKFLNYTEISTKKIPFISPEFPRGSHEEITAGMIPWNSPINPRGNLGDVDGSPAGW